MRVLLVEDDPSLSRSLAAQLEQAGYSVERTTDGREGLYYAREYPVDLAIGHPVRVTTRDRPRRSFLSTVEEIGAQIEPITNAIAYLRPGALVDAGLPFVVGLPPSIRIRPGEIVDLQLTSPAAPASPTQARSLPSRHP